MPPKKQLSDDHIATLSQWITAGAVWLPEELDVKKQVATAEELGDLPGGYRPVFALALSPDDQRLAAGHGNEVIIHGLGEKSSRLAKLAGHRDVVQSIAWSPDGKHLATGGYRKVILWNTADWTWAGALNGLPGRVSALAFSARQPVAHHRQQRSTGRCRRSDPLEHLRLGQAPGLARARRDGFCHRPRAGWPVTRHRRGGSAHPVLEHGRR